MKDDDPNRQRTCAGCEQMNTTANTNTGTISLTGTVANSFAINTLHTHTYSPSEPNYEPISPRNRNWHLVWFHFRLAFKALRRALRGG